MSDLSKAESTQYPAAHLGHLTDDQQAALDKFKALCQEHGYYTPPSDDGSKQASHDDATLLRYLRARKFNPPEALKQFKETEDWRRENKLDQLYDTMDIAEYEESRRLYPQWTGRRDKRGIPVYVFEVAPLNSKAINEYQNSMTKSPLMKSSKVPTKMLRLFALYENLTRFVLPLCSAIPDRPHPETPITQSNNIVDISGVGLKQFWNLKSHMQDASQLATAHYPETLDRIFIIGAPSFFPTVWGWIKRWFDPITVSKIFILSASDMKPTLEKYIDIENIPKKYGGRLDFEWGMMPLLEPEIANALQWKEGGPMLNGSRTIPTGPIKWRSSGPSGTSLEMVASGSENGVQRNKVLAEIQTPFCDMHGISRQNTKNTPVRWELERVQSTTGTSTQPKEEGDLYFGAELASPQGTPQASGSATPAQIVASVPGANNTADTPAKPVEDGSNNLRPSATQPREGTSETKLEQQNTTLAAGANADGTPHTIHYGSGDKAQTVEPATVGQAQKDISANLPRPEEAPASGVLQQAQAAVAGVAGAASSAVASVTGAMSGLAVGVKKESTEDVEESKDKLEDPKVDRAGDEKVEEYIKSQYPSTSPLVAEK
ncbi:uncharacterized protein PV09_08085 [Verruconis gallopava]|uniref:CRAL-TRIO domain-containing protein n=1 Tax=Verruconis gallopava TaxID=253628 RepID=A0A0D2A218_9PEZI|nr:uncharacterized protein PV09_08085 [Verruconis gallopava]KIW00375.1 hypothetical protein PV09_08085 [Verruconis gallopava]